MQIYKVPKDRRYWVVRAESGLFYDHFTKFGVIALGHLDDLNLEESGDEQFRPNTESVENDLKRVHEAQSLKSKRTSTHLNQVKAFISEMNIGDWVLTVGLSSIRFGRITGTPRIDKKNLPIVYDEETGRKIVLGYNLRRKVTWGPSIIRSLLPFGLLKSLRANQTLFNIDHHWDAVYHTLYPVFRRENSLYLSARINTEERVKNYSIVSLLGFLNEIEVIAKEFDSLNSGTEFDTVFQDYVENNGISITTKAEFHSPGEIWNEITSLASNLDSWVVYAVCAYGMIFGNQKLGFDGLLDLQTRQKFWDLVIDRMKKHNIKDVVTDLKLTAPTSNTEKLESDDKDEKL